MPSSTSSSELYQRHIPDKRWRVTMVIALVFALVAVILWEILARSMHHLPGTYQGQFSSMWAEERRKLDQPDHQIKLVLVGSSRLFYAADLDIMEEQFGTRPLQLAIAGTSPALFFEDLVNNTNFDGLVLVGVTPYLFNRLDRGFFGGGALDWYQGVAPSKYTGAAIHHFLSDYLGFLDEAFTLSDLIEHYSGFPNREGATNLNQQGWKLGDIYADRQADLWPPVEEIGSFDNQEVINFWMPLFSRPLPTKEENEKRVSSTIEFFKPLIATLRERGGDVVFIRMPSDGKYLERDLASNHREDVWLPIIEGLDVPAINSMDHAELSSELEIPEWSHLSRASQDLFSIRIVPYIEEAYLAKRGKSVYEVMGITVPDGE